MASKNRDTRCSGRTKSGNRCCAAATPGGLCFLHANPNKAAEIGRIGGRSKGHAAAEIDPLPLLDNALAVRDSLARIINDVHAGKLQPRVAASLVGLLNLQLRAIEAVAKLKLVDGEKPAKDMTGEELDQTIRDSKEEIAQAKAMMASCSDDSLELSKSLLEIA